MAKHDTSMTIQEIFDRTMRLAKRSEENFIELGRLLRRLQDEDPALFRLAHEQAGLGRRTAYSYAKVARAFDGLPITDKDLATIGSTRAVILAPHVNKENCGTLVALAATTSTRDLRIVTEGGEPVPGSRAVLLYLSPADHARFLKALLAHGAVAGGVGLQDKEKALMTLLDVVEGGGA